MTEILSLPVGDLIPAENRASEITSLHNEIVGHLRQSLEKALLIGELLAEQKESLQHGEFGPWVKTNLPFTGRTARNYMALYRARDKIKTETLSDLTEAYDYLKGPKQIDHVSSDDEERFKSLTIDDLDKFPPDENISLLDLSTDVLKRMIRNSNSQLNWCGPDYVINEDTGWVYKNKMAEGMESYEITQLALAFNILMHGCYWSNVAKEHGLRKLPRQMRIHLKENWNYSGNRKARRMCRTHCHEKFSPDQCMCH